jgi:hypothetical protein
VQPDAAPIAVRSGTDTAAVPSGSGANSVSTTRRKRVDGRTRSARRVKQLIAGYAKRLDRIAVDPIVAADIAKLAEHEALAEDLRAAALRREPIDHTILNQHERAVRRLRTALALDRLPELPPAPSLDSYRGAKHGGTP